MNKKVKDTDECTIEENEWRELEEKVSSESSLQDGKSRRELMLIWGVRKDAAAKRINLLIEKDAVEQGWKYMIDNSGRKQKVPAYRIIKK